MNQSKVLNQILKPLALCTTLLLFTSCDYIGDYYYIVKNESETDTIQLKVSTSLEEEYTIFKIPPKSKEKVFEETSGILGMWESPPDYFEDYIYIFTTFDVQIKDSLVSADFREKKYWRFLKEGNHESTYTLILTEELLRIADSTKTNHNYNER